jgi:Uma2 family endonuclease
MPVPRKPTVAANNQVKFTSKDIMLLGEESNKRYEVIEGELFVSRQPSAEHQYSCGRAFRAIDQWNDSSQLGMALVAPGVIFSSDNDVALDVAWISYEKLAVRTMDDAGHLHVCPELVIEVLSPGSRNEQRDRETKLHLYSRRGASEYWIIDWMRRQLLVYRRENAALQLVATLRDSEELTTPLLPGFSCRVSDLFFLPPVTIERL